jgi:hypothetical protein
MTARAARPRDPRGREQFYLSALDPRPGDGFVTLHPIPSRRPTSSPGPAVRVRPAVADRALSGIRKVELLTHVPRGRGPTSASPAAAGGEGERAG